MKTKKITGILLALITGAVLSGTAAYAENVINVKDCGALGDGKANDTQAIRLALETAVEKNIGTVYFPRGTYVTISEIELPSGLCLNGEGALSVIKTMMTGSEQAVFTGTGISGVEISGLSFEAAGDKIYAALFKGSDSIRIENNTANGCAMVKYEPWYGEETINCTNTLTVNNNLDGKGTKLPAINNISGSNGIVTGNIIKNYNYGIAFGNEEQELPVNNICSQNIISGITECGVITENNERFTVGGNTLKDIGTGIIIKNCKYASVMNNVINGFSEAGMSLQRGGSGLNINANEIYSNCEGAKLFEICRSDLKFGQRDINLTANTFHCTDGARARVCGGDADMLSVSGNHFYNTVMDFSMYESRSLMISANQLIFEGEYDGVQTAVKAGSTCGQLMIQNNQITGIGMTAAESCGIHAIQSGSGISALTYIKGNTVSGMTVDIKTTAASEDPLVKPVFIIKNNCFGNRAYEREEGNTQSCTVRLEDNYTSGGLNYPSQIPSSGKWEKGQIIYFNSDNETGYIGAVCIAKGTPGIWKYFGELEQ